jgi:hypothetical protein
MTSGLGSEEVRAASSLYKLVGETCCLARFESFNLSSVPKNGGMNVIAAAFINYVHIKVRTYMPQKDNRQNDYLYATLVSEQLFEKNLIYRMINVP